MEDFVIKEGVHKIGNPCKKCGYIIRYVKSRSCVLCGKEYRKQRLENIKESNKDKGLYYEGIPCKKCGNCIRYVKGGTCVLCKKEQEKQRYKNNKEVNKDISTHYTGKPCIKCGSCVRYVSTDKCVLCRKMQHKNWRENNPEYNKQYHKRNPEKSRAKNQRRRALKQNAEGGFTDQEWIDLCNYYGNKCIVPGCENTNLEADHIVPLTKGGTNWITNIQPLCISCNRSKGTKTIDYRTV